MVDLIYRSAVIAALLAAGCGSIDQQASEHANDETPTFKGMSIEEERIFRASWVPKGEATEEQIQTLCVACHTFPEPDSLPQVAWEEEMRKAYRFIALANRPDWVVPDIDDTTAWFKERSLDWTEYSKRLTEPEVDGLSSAGGFKRVNLDWPRDERLSAAASIQTATESDRSEVLLTDIATGRVWSIERHRAPIRLNERFRSDAPCRIRRCDLDQNSAPDFLIADLGEFAPSDHSKGKLWWCRPSETEPAWAAAALLEDVGRVADAQPLDLDRDGDLDLIVAEFGFVETGAIHLLRNVGVGDDGTPLFEREILDDRHGTAEVPVADINGDGWPDFVALITQEHELVEAFINNHNGGFDHQTIADIASPTFGFSDLSLVDIDNDGDLDAITANGDTLDSGYPSPDHGVIWWRNNGTFPFERVDLAKIPGCYAIEPADLDQDGDLDLSVVAYLDTVVTSSTLPGAYKGVIWLEQQPGGRFVEHVIERESVKHLCVQVLDWNRDGRPDILTGPFSFRPRLFAGLTVYLNEL